MLKIGSKQKLNQSSLYKVKNPLNNNFKQQEQ